MNKQEFSTHFKKALALYPHQAPEPETIEAYFETLRDLPEGVFKTALQNAIRNSTTNFLPPPGAIWTAANSMYSPPRMTGRTGDADCPNCGGYGYYVLDVKPENPKYGHMFGKAQKCQCFRVPHNVADREAA